MNLKKKFIKLIKKFFDFLFFLILIIIYYFFLARIIFFTFLNLFFFFIFYENEEFFFNFFVVPCMHFLNKLGSCNENFGDFDFWGSSPSERRRYEPPFKWREPQRELAGRKTWAQRQREKLERERLIREEKERRRKKLLKRLRRKKRRFESVRKWSIDWEKAMMTDRRRAPLRRRSYRSFRVIDVYTKNIHKYIILGWLYFSIKTSFLVWLRCRSMYKYYKWENYHRNSLFFNREQHWDELEYQEDEILDDWNEDVENLFTVEEEDREDETEITITYLVPQRDEDLSSALDYADDRHLYKQVQGNKPLYLTDYIVEPFPDFVVNVEDDGYVGFIRDVYPFVQEWDEFFDFSPKVDALFLEGVFTEGPHEDFDRAILEMWRRTIKEYLDRSKNYPEDDLEDLLLHLESQHIELNLFCSEVEDELLEELPEEIDLEGPIDTIENFEKDIGLSYEERWRQELRAVRLEEYAEKDYLAILWAKTYTKWILEDIEHLKFTNLKDSQHGRLIDALLDSKHIALYGKISRANRELEDVAFVLEFKDCIGYIAFLHGNLLWRGLHLEKNFFGDEVIDPEDLEEGYDEVAEADEEMGSLLGADDMRYGRWILTISRIVWMTLEFVSHVYILETQNSCYRYLEIETLIMERRTKAYDWEWLLDTYYTLKTKLLKWYENDFPIWQEKLEEMKNLFKEQYLKYLEERRKLFNE